MFDLSAASATIALIAANVAASLWGLYGDRKFVEAYALRVGDVLERRQWYRVITSGFLHGSVFHLFVNMLTLFFFGPAIEGKLGTGRFLILYFGAELAANLFSLWAKRRAPDYASIGASGAVSGVLFAFCLFAPLRLIYIFGVIPIPAIGFAVLFTLYSAYAMGGGPRGRIAHEAHLGGAVAGVLITIALYPAAFSIFLSNFS